MFFSFFCITDVTCRYTHKNKQKILIMSILLTTANYNDQVLQEPEARSLGGRVFGGITQRLAARLLQQILTVPSVSTTSS